MFEVFDYHNATFAIARLAQPRYNSQLIILFQDLSTNANTTRKFTEQKQKTLGKQKEKKGLKKYSHGNLESKKKDTTVLMQIITKGSKTNGHAQRKSLQK